MNFKECLINQLKKHPQAMPQDIIKMCYQAAFGGEHLSIDFKKAKDYLYEESERTLPCEGELYEQISEDIYRVNLSAWKYEGFPCDLLFKIFTLSFKETQGGEAEFLKLTDEASEVLKREKVNFSYSEWEDFFKGYLKKGITPLHHSDKYREAEKPAYRIVKKELIRIIPILKKALALKDKTTPLIIAIDGRAASGKTTIADNLKELLSADIIHMDDFFLPPSLRSPERFKRAGENIHHERFLKEVIPFISKNDAFSYRIFDCQRMDFNGERKIESKIRIVEGSYSLNPVFGDYADILVFSDVSEREQIERIRKRNGEEMLKMFTDKWIPLEEEYFEFFKIRDKANFIV